MAVFALATDATEPHGKVHDVDDVSTTYGDSVASTPDLSVCGGTVVSEAPTTCFFTEDDIDVGEHFEVELAMRFFALMQSLECCPSALSDKRLAVDRTCKNIAVVRVKKCFRTLAAAGCSRKSIEIMAAHVATYMSALMASRVGQDCAELPPKECSYTLCLLMFLAHSYTEDVTLPLRTWHEHLFVHDGSLSMLNTALSDLMQKLNYKLRLCPLVLGQHLAVLC